MYGGGGGAYNIFLRVVLIMNKLINVIFISFSIFLSKFDEQQ